MNPISEAVQEKREEGIRRASEAQDRRSHRWSDVAFAFLRFYATGHHVFTSEEVTKAFNAANEFDKPKDGRAWGAVYLRAVKEGVMVKSDETYQRENGHGAPAFKWRSLICVKRKGAPVGAAALAAQLPLGAF